MFLRYFIALSLLFAMVFSAPFLINESQELNGEPLFFDEPTDNITTSLTDDANLPQITLPETINYETKGDGFEGDMIFPDGFDPTKESQSRGVAIAGSRQWPGNVLPYDLSGITSQADRDLIQRSIHILMYAVATPVAGQTTRQSCVYFRPRTQSDKNYFRFAYGNGCSSTVGFVANQDRVVTLQKNGCFYEGTIQHELLHTLGFFHEQSRPDRDSYITINSGNIQSGTEHNFNKYKWGSEVLNQNTRYDYDSIMHYGATAFSKNGQPTITLKYSGKIGQRNALSATDIAEVRAYYGCK